MMIIYVKFHLLKNENAISLPLSIDDILFDFLTFQPKRNINSFTPKPVCLSFINDRLVKFKK